VAKPLSPRTNTKWRKIIWSPLFRPRRSEEIRLDLAVAKFHVAGPAAALAELDNRPAGSRQGDWFLLRAQILDAQGQTAEAVESLNQGLHAAPTRADLCCHSALFLIKHKQVRQAIDLLRQASLAFPDAAELLLMAAALFGAAPVTGLAPPGEC